MGNHIWEVRIFFIFSESAQQIPAPETTTPEIDRPLIPKTIKHLPQSQRHPSYISPKQSYVPHRQSYEPPYVPQQPSYTRPQPDYSSYHKPTPARDELQFTLEDFTPIPSDLIKQFHEDLIKFQEYQEFAKEHNILPEGREHIAENK